VSRTDVAVQATGLIELRQERAEVVMLRTLARRAGRPGLGARNRRVPCADQHGAVTSTWAPSIAPTSMALWRPHGRCPSRRPAWRCGAHMGAVRRACPGL